MKARPSFQFYPSDHLRDPALRSCSLAARGLWIDILAFMHEAEPYGHLRLNGKDIEPSTLARMVGATLREVQRLMSELEAAGVFSRTGSGTIYSRRMVRDQALREKRAQFGHLSQEHPDVPKKKGPSMDTLKDTLPGSLPGSIGGSPSSSSSSSSSERKEKEPPYTPPGGNGCGPSAFNIFWKEYPRKEGKGAVERWFRKHRPDDVLLGTMLAKIDRFKDTEQWQKDGGQFIPMPTTWLNQRRWQDEPRPNGNKTCRRRTKAAGERFLHPCGQPVALGDTLCPTHRAEADRLRDSVSPDGRRPTKVVL